MPLEGAFLSSLRLRIPTGVWVANEVGKPLSSLYTNIDVTKSQSLWMDSENFHCDIYGLNIQVI